MAGKSSTAGDVYSGSETAARLADYSGAQYYFISGRSTVAAEFSPETAVALADESGLAVPTIRLVAGNEKDSSTSKDHKTDNPGKDPAKVSVLQSLS